MQKQTTGTLKWLTREQNGVHPYRRLTSHDTDITVAIGQDVVEGGLLWQAPNNGGLGKRAHFLFPLCVEALHLVGQTHHLRQKQNDSSDKDGRRVLLRSINVTRITHLESENKLDSVCKRCRARKTKPLDQSEEKEVEKRPGQTQCRSEPCRQRHKTRVLWGEW